MPNYNKSTQLRVHIAVADWIVIILNHAMAIWSVRSHHHAWMHTNDYHVSYIVAIGYTVTSYIATYYHKTGYFYEV